MSDLDISADIAVDLKPAYCNAVILSIDIGRVRFILVAQDSPACCGIYFPLLTLLLFPITTFPLTLPPILMPPTLVLPLSAETLLFFSLLLSGLDLSISETLEIGPSFKRFSIAL